MPSLREVNAEMAPEEVPVLPLAKDCQFAARTSLSLSARFALGGDPTVWREKFPRKFLKVLCEVCRIKFLRSFCRFRPWRRPGSLPREVPPAALRISPLAKDRHFAVRSSPSLSVDFALGGGPAVCREKFPQVLCGVCRENFPQPFCGFRPWWRPDSLP